jgi:antitoxin FitA
MPKMIQIRNVPDDLHRELKTRAAKSEMTLSDYLLRELEGLSVRPTMREWLARSLGARRRRGASRGDRRRARAALIVADASAVVEVLLARPRAEEVRRALAGHSELHVPEHFHVEAAVRARRSKD